MSASLHMYTSKYLVMCLVLTSKRFYLPFAGLVFSLVWFPESAVRQPTNPQCFVTVGGPKNPEGVSCSVMDIIFPLGLKRVNNGHLYIWTELLSIFFSWYSHMRWQLGTKITPQGLIFWTMIFYNLKNSSQDLSNEGSNFILSSLEVGYWVALI